jgi:O-antigen/teichoic acid export membrane protein
VALAANVVLNLVLIPRLGIVGAAIAWSVSILVNNLAPLAQVWALMRVHPFGPGSPIAAGAALALFGAGGLAARAAFGASLATAALFGASAAVAYAAVVWRFRSTLELESFRLRRTPARGRSPETA